MKKQLIETYLDWRNNFVTLRRFAEYYEISEDAAQMVIDAGRIVHENEVAFQKAMKETEF